MARHTILYGLDIETDLRVGGLDPSVVPIVTVALSLPHHDEIFTGDEATILVGIAARVRRLRPGVIATWNGAAFDLPFLADRAECWGIDLGLRLRHDPRIRLHHEPLPGHEGGYRARWFEHAHLDTYRLYRDVSPMVRVSSTLRSLARFVGLAPLDVDRSRITDLAHEARHASAANDARLARALAERRWPGAARFVDRVARPEAAPAHQVA